MSQVPASAAPRRPDDLTLRPVRAEDHDAWLSLWRRYQTFCGVDVPAATTAVVWQRLLDPAEPMHGVLAWLGTRAVGFAHWIYHRSFWSVGDYCYGNDGFTDPDVRGLGVGRALMEHVYREAEAAGSPSVYWLTHESNAVAMQLYDRMGERSGFVHYRKAFPDNR